MPRFGFLSCALCLVLAGGGVVTGCATTREKPCLNGGQPARDARDKPFNGDRRCTQRKNSEGQYVNDGLYREIYPNGRVALEGEYKDGKKVGIWTEYDEKGKKIAVRHWVRGVEVPPPAE